MHTFIAAKSGEIMGNFPTGKMQTYLVQTKFGSGFARWVVKAKPLYYEMRKIQSYRCNTTCVFRALFNSSEHFYFITMYFSIHTSFRVHLVTIWTMFDSVSYIDKRQSLMLFYVKNGVYFSCVRHYSCKNAFTSTATTITPPATALHTTSFLYLFWKVFTSIQPSSIQYIKF